MALKYVDLNSDIGESFGAYTLGMDSDVLTHVTSANIACGWHAGDPLVMEKTVEKALENQVGIGAHPGFPDLMGFGRREMKITPAEAKTYVIYQVGALAAFAAAAGTRLQHVKPHGAFYNMAAKDASLADAIAQGVKAVDDRLILMGLAGGQLVKAGEKAGLKVASEVFADRGYNPDGTLVARGQPGAMIEDTALAVERVIRMVTEGRVQAVTGEDLTIQADSICVHGDGPQALAFVRDIRKGLEEAGVHIQPLAAFIR